MAKVIPLPNGSYFPIDEGQSVASALAEARRYYPEAFTQQQPEQPKPEAEGGFFPALKAGYSALKSDIAGLAGRTGIMDLPEAEKYIAEQKKYQAETFKPTTKSFVEDPLANVKELLGGSLPYMAAPAAAGVAALALPEAAAGTAILGGLSTVGEAAGLGAAGLTSAAQFTGSNISRQVDTGKKLGETDLVNAALAAIPQAALDTVSLRMIPGLGKIFERAGINLGKKEVENFAGEAIKKTAADYALKTGRTMGIEGLTEAGQQVFERAQAGLSITDPEARQEYFDSFIGGAVLGGVIAPAGRYIERGQAQTRYDMGEAVKQQTAQQEQLKLDAIAAAEEERKKSSPEYFQTLSAEYKAAEKAKNDLKAQLRKVVAGSETETADRLHNTEITAQIKEMSPGVQALAAEYNRLQKVQPQEEVAAMPTNQVALAVGDTLDNPLGNFTKEELASRAPTVAKYIDAERKKAGKPALDSYSIEDIRNAMPNQLPEAEQADLSSLIAAKSGHTGDITYKPTDVIEVAKQKNIDTTTDGFKDFLRRATGDAELEQLTQPQLHSAFKALSSLPRFDEPQILPQKRNATDYSKDQYDKAVAGMQKLVEDRKLGTEVVKEGEKPIAKPVSIEEAHGVIKAKTGLKNDADIQNLFREANRNGDIDFKGNEVTYQPKGAQAEFNIEEGFAPAEGTGFNVMRDGEMLFATNDEAEANAKAEKLGKNAAPAISQIDKSINKENATVADSQRALDAMEAEGKFNTPQYTQAAARHAGVVDKANKTIESLNAKKQMLQKPVTVQKAGKPTNRKTFTVKEKGVPEKAFNTRQEAEQHALENLPEQRLNELSTQTKAPGFANRLKKEQERRKKPVLALPAPKPKGPSAEATALHAKLLPMLRKFGLGDVALKIEEAMQNEGEYSASVIKVALDATNPLGVLRHEVIHGLKDLGFFTPGQWKILENKADKEWTDKYLRQRNVDGGPLKAGEQSRYDAYDKEYNGDVDAIREEAISDAFRDFDVNGAPKGLFAQLLNAMRKFFRNLRAALNGAGYETAEDIFGKVERGELKATKAAEGEKSKPSLTTKKEEDVDPNDVSRVVTDGPYADAAVRTMNSQITQTSKPLEVDDVGRLFDKAFFNEFKRKGDWKNEKDFKRAVNQAISELKYQIQQTKSGLDWYEQDIAEAFKQTQIYIPSLKKPEKRALFSVIAGIMSPSVNARDNWAIAAQAYQHYEKTGTLPGNNPATGGLWQGGLESANKKKQLDMFNAMLQPKSKGGLGEKGAVEWLQEDHTVAEITDLRQKYGGMGKSSTGGKASDMLPGFTAFGPKVGPFVMNINGLHNVTVDVWMTRTFNRYFGQMMGPDDKMVRAPTEPQRVAVKKLAVDAAAQVGIKPYQVQSVLWFFEQQLFNKLGTGAKSYGFSDGAIKFAQSQGGTGVPKGATANVGANAPANGAAGKQAVGTGTQANQPTTGKTGQRGISNGTKLSVSSGKFTLRPGTGSGQILTGSDFDGRGFVAPEGLGQAAEEHDIRRDREVGKRPYVETSQGDGRGFTGFFSNISLGFKGKPNAKPYEPTLNVEPIADFVREYNNHRGNFDDHIATSIPGFREVQTIVGNAIAKTYKSADMLDIGASEGALIKAITKMSDGKVRTVALDPNFAMAKHFNDGEKVEGAVYDTSAFGTKDDEGQLAWTEDNELVDRDKQVTENPFAGEEVRWFKPDRKFDVIHEAMVFQFISGNRAGQIARAKELMKPDGVLIIEEKFVVGYKLSPEQFRANEAKKDSYKEQYFTKAEIEAKAKAVGVAEKAAFKADQDKKEQAATGMNDLMVAPGAIEDVLSSKFDHVAQFWDSGNFKGYIASDSPEAVERLINNMLPTDSEFANVKTPRTVKSSIASPREGIVLGKLQDGAVEFSGVHYGNAKTDELQGSKYGTGLRGAERRRLENTDDARIKNRVYFYVQKPDGSMPIPESGVGNYVYTQKFKNILGPGKLMSRLFSEARADSNAFESSVVDAGYDGYAIPNMGMMVILNHNVPTNYRGTRAEILEKGTKLSLRKVREIFDRAESISEPPGVEAIREQWIGGVSGIGDRSAMYDLYRVGGSKKYIQDVQDFIRKELGDDFKGYRLMSNEELEEIQTGSMGSQFASFTLNPDIARAFKNIPAYAKKTGMSVVEMDLTPEHVAMIGHPGELELVVDYGQGYNPDEVKVIEKYSLRTAPNTPEFKRFFGDSKIVDADGNPKVMYHGTAQDITTFKPKQAGAIFLTNNPQFASEYAEIAAGYKAFERQLSDYSPQELAKARAQAISDVKSSYGFSKEAAGLIKEIKSANPTGEASDFLKTAADKLFPVAGQNIMPVFVRAERPFDYENPEHIKALGLKDVTTDSLANNVARLESDRVQNAIRAAGFDGFYIKQGNEKNLAVYDPAQIKSATGNEGTYDISNPDIRKSLRTAGEPATKENVLAAMHLEQAKQPYMNCLLCVQMATGVPKLLNLPRVKKAQVGDVYTFNERKDMASHYAIDIGNGDIAEVEGWGEDVRVLPLQSVVDEYGEPDSILRPPETAYTDKTPPVRPSLRTNVKNDLSNMPNGAAILATMNRVTPPREQKGFVERITNALAPEAFSYFRQQALDRYNRLSDYDKLIAKQMGGVDLLADQSAHWAALHSDNAAGVTASALGVGDRMGGTPVLKNGYVTVSNLNGTVKGVVDIIAPLARHGDPDIYRLYQLWSAAKRGTRLFREGRFELLTPAEIKDALTLEQKYPEFVTVQQDWIKYNNGLVKLQVDAGVITKEAGQEFMKYSDYIPLYRQMDGEKTLGPSIYQSIGGVKAPKTLKGKGTGPIEDYLETIVRNTQAAIQSSMKNVAAKKAVENGMMLGMVVKLPTVSSAPDTITILENGQKVSYQCADRLWVEAVSSLNLPELPFLSILAKPADLLRALVTKDPGFMLANMMRDSLSAYITSGANINPLVSTVKNYGAAMMNRSPVYQALLNAGALGGYEFSRNVEAGADSLARDLRKKTGTQSGAEKLFKPFTGVWNMLERGTEASDAATRMAVYEATLKETGNEGEAIRRAVEVMNFNRKGRSAVVRIAAAAIPFLNARVQGLDVFFRAGIRPFYDKNATAYEKQVQKAMLIRGATIMALSTMYAAAIMGDPDYEKQEQETKDNFWLIPSLGIKLPIPFEVGTLFKTVPERIYRYYYGADTSKDLGDSMKRALLSTLAFNPVPQAVAPLLEARDNYSVFTQRPIVGEAMRNIAPEYQVGPSTTKIAEFLGKQTGMSPIMIDHVYKGYTGTMGMYLADVMDAVFTAGSDNPKASQRFEQTPVLKRFLLDPEAKGQVSAYYDLKNSVDQTVRTVNLLAKQGSPDLEGYVNENISMLGVKKYVSSVDKQMQKLSARAAMIRSTPMPADEKRKMLDEITKIQNELTNEVQLMKKMARP